MSSFLDSTGLSELATKLKAYFMKKPTSASTSSYPLVGYDATNNVGKYNSDIKMDLQWGTIDAYSWLRTYTVTNGTFKFGTLTDDAIKRYGGVTFLATTRDYQDRNLVFLLYLQRGSYSHGDTTSHIVARKIVLSGRDQRFIQYDDVEFYYDWRSNKSTDFYVKVGSSSRVTLTVLSAVQNGFTISSTWNTSTTLPSDAVAFTPQIMIKGSKTGGESDPVCGSTSIPVYVDSNGQVQPCTFRTVYSGFQYKTCTLGSFPVVAKEMEVSISGDFAFDVASYPVHFELCCKTDGSSNLYVGVVFTKYNTASTAYDSVKIKAKVDGSTCTLYLSLNGDVSSGVAGRISFASRTSQFTPNISNVTTVPSGWVDADTTRWI